MQTLLGSESGCLIQCNMVHCRAISSHSLHKSHRMWWCCHRGCTVVLITNLIISTVSAHSDLSSRTDWRSRFSWNFWCESIFPLEYFSTYRNPSSKVPLLLLVFVFLCSEQRIQRAGVRLDHEAQQNIIRFLLLTFRYFFNPFFKLWMSSLKMSQLMDVSFLM